MGEKPLRESNLPFVMPEDVALRPAAEKRVLTICNLFANQKLSVPQIVSLLDESYGTVLQALISHRLILDRRKNPPVLIKGERRLSHFTL